VEELVRFRASLVHMRTQVKNKIHALLGRNGIVAPLGSIFGKTGRRWLAELELSALHRAHLEEYLALLDRYDEQIATATQRIAAVVADDASVALLLSVPGISYVSALSIMSEIDTIDRFPSGKQVASYAGLTPSVYASGDSVRYGRLTKKGSKTLRTILIEVAHSQGRLKQTTGLRPYFDRIKARKGSRTATVATARKLCSIIHAVLTARQPFDDTRIVA